MELQQEIAVVRWLAQSQLASLVPRVLWTLEDTEYVAAVFSELPGEMSFHGKYLIGAAYTAKLLGSGLRMIHSLPVTGCPADMRLENRLLVAQDRLRNQEIDVVDFDDARKQTSPKELMEYLLAHKPASTETAFTHGDFCLPNILIDQSGISGFIDWGRSGVADIYQDIALCVRSIVRNLGEQWIQTFSASYGIAELDAEKVTYYQILDEFF